MNTSGSLSCPTSGLGLDPVVLLIIDVIRWLPWKRIVVVHDNFGRTQWPALELLPQDISVIVFEYGENQTGSDVTATAILDETLDPYGPDVNFLLLCNISCVTDVFDTVNGYDKVANEQGTFTFKAKWLIALQRHFMKEVENSLGNIINVAAVVSGSTRLYTALYLPSGRGFTVVDAMSDITPPISSAVFPNSAYALNGRKFIVSTNMWGPFVKKSVDAYNHTTYYGMCISMLETLSSVLNFTYTLVEPPDGGWGSRDENGTWDGLVRQLHFKEVDIAVAPLLSSHKRETVVDFTYPFYTDHTIAVYRTPTGGATTQFFLFLTPFSWHVWLGLVAAILVIGVVLALFWWYHPLRYSTRQMQVTPASQKMPRRQSVASCRTVPLEADDTIFGQLDISEESIDIKPKSVSYFTSFTGKVWVAFGSIFSQEVSDKPVNASARVVFGFWCLFALIVSATYSGNLVAFLTVQKVVVPFKTLDELADNPTYYLGTLGTSAWQSLLEESTTGVYSQLWLKVRRSLQDGVPALHTKVDPHLALVKNGGYVFISDTVSVSELVTQNCEIKIMDQKFQPVFNAVAFQNNSAYRDIFSIAIARFEESGILAYWKQKHWARVLACDNQARSSHHALPVDGVKGLFIFTGALLLLSVLILIVEKGIARNMCTCVHKAQTPHNDAQNH